jgi:hypothetical protein
VWGATFRHRAGRAHNALMTKRRTHPGDTGDSRRLALAVGRGGLNGWLAAEEARLAEFEAAVERAPISIRRGRWLERRVPEWAADARVKFAAARKTFRLALLLGGGGRHLDAMEARQAAAFARVLERVAEERAKGWPRRTLCAAGPEVG